MNVFDLRKRLVSDYAEYVGSFIQLRDERIRMYAAPGACVSHDRRTRELCAGATTCATTTCRATGVCAAGGSAP